MHKKWHDQFPRPVTKGLCAPVIRLLMRLDKGEFCMGPVFAQHLVFIVTFDAANVV